MSEQYDLISIIVPVYNVKNYLEQCLNSLANQTYKNIEVLLVNDGSTDGSDKICEKYSLKDSRFKKFDKPNSGLADARNLGIKNSHGKYIAFVDSDDYVDHGFILELYTILQKYKANISIAGYTVFYENTNFRSSFSYDRSGVISAEAVLSSILTDETIANFVCNKLFEKELFNRVKFPSGKAYEDVAVFYKLVAASKKLCITSKCLYYYRKRFGSITTSVNPKSTLDGLEAATARNLYVSSHFPTLKKECINSDFSMLVYSYNQLAKSRLP